MTHTHASLLLVLARRRQRQHALQLHPSGPNGPRSAPPPPLASAIAIAPQLVHPADPLWPGTALTQQQPHAA